MEQHFLFIESTLQHTPSCNNGRSHLVERAMSLLPATQLHAKANDGTPEPTVLYSFAEGSI